MFLAHTISDILMANYNAGKKDRSGRDVKKCRHFMRDCGLLKRCNIYLNILYVRNKKELVSRNNFEGFKWHALIVINPILQGDCSADFMRSADYRMLRLQVIRLR